MDIVINSAIPTVPEGCMSLPIPGDFYSNLLASMAGFNLRREPTDAGNDLPVADLLRHYYQLDGEGWLIASPIHWQASHNDAMIVASGETLALCEDESRLWFAAFKEYLSVDNINAHYHDPATWLIQCKGRPALAAKPVYRLHHQSMMSELKQLDSSLFWMRFITETQMFFSAHPLNNARIGDKPIINGVWVWGGGVLPAPQSTPLVCYDPELVKLARVLTTRVIDGRDSTFDEKNGVLLFQNLNERARMALQEKFKKYTTRWYWNNLAYLNQPKNWLSRLLKRA